MTVAPSAPSQPGARSRLSSDTRQLLSVRDVAQRLSCGRTLIYKLIDDGELEAVKLGRLRRVPVGAIDEFVDRLRARHGL